MFSANPWRAFIALVLIIGLANVKPASALGTPRITSINPASGSPVGSNVCVRAEVDWDSDFRSMRIRFGNEGWNESAEINFERCFGTSNYSPGWYKIRVEVAKVGEDWGSATWTEADYELTAQQNNPPPQQNPSISCSVDSFDVWPQSATVGDIIHVSGSGSCNVGVRAIKFLVDGQDPHEFGGPSNNWDWNTSGYSAGQHKLKLWVAGLGDNNWDYAANSSNITVQLSAPGQPAANPDTSIPFDNCGVIGLNDGRIYVVTTDQGFEKHHVPNPETLDALGIPRAWIDNKGWSNSELKSIHEGSDIPDVNRNRSGFDTFKSRCFPHTVPIVPNNQSQAQPNQSVQPVVPGVFDPHAAGVCSGWETRLWIGAPARVTNRGDQLALRTGPSTSEGKITKIYSGQTFTVIGGPKCADGYTWWNIQGDMGTGWSVEAGEENGKSYWWLAPITDPPVPQQNPPPVLVVPTATQVPQVEAYTEQVQPDQPNEPPVEESGNPFWCNWFVVGPLFCQNASEVDASERPATHEDLYPWAPRGEYTDRTQCVYFMGNEKCPDARLWLGQGNAESWDEFATSEKAKLLGVTTHSSPEPGDIVVWNPWCGIAFGEGHTGYVSSVNPDKTFNTIDRNAFSDGKTLRRGNIEVLSCMTFIRNACQISDKVLSELKNGPSDNGSTNPFKDWVDSWWPW